MKKTAILLTLVAAYCAAAETRPLVDLAADVEKARQDINAAI